MNNGIGEANAIGKKAVVLIMWAEPSLFTNIRTNKCFTVFYGGKIE